MRRSARLRIKVEIPDTISSTINSASNSAPFVPILSQKLLVKGEKSNSNDWTSLCSARELSCALTLESGQVFSWQRHPTEIASWVGVIGRRVFALRERHDDVQFQCLHPSNYSIQEGFNELSYYFRLDVPADPLYERWTEIKDQMSESIQRLRGLRIVRQDPVQCLFSFICSSNNNIARIQGMVDRLKVTYGDLIFKAGFTAQKDEQLSFYAFPSVDTLARKCKEEKLRELGFGYRAAFIVKTAKQLEELGGAAYLTNIRDGKTVAGLDLSQSLLDDAKAASYHAYQDELMVFAGVGRKVADCVALFSLEKLEAIPVDTHVWQIACRELDPTLSDRKSITPSVYRWVGDLFRTRFAPQAGWAHSVLFASDLPVFKLKSSDGKIMTKVKQPGAKRKFQQDVHLASTS